jgi:heme-degrading monooxygenase HmoA
MIARMWRGFTKPGMADAYARHLYGTLLPELQAIAGFRDVQLLRRDLPDGVEIVVMTYWESMEAIRAFAGEDAERAVVAAEARPLFQDYDATVKHFTIVMNPARG